jgi:hypothetical protein
MRLRFAAAVVAVMTAWPTGVRAEGPGARVKQADRPGAVAGAESFDSAKTYFDRARKLGFPAAGSGAPYVLRAEFTTRGSSGVVQTGTYTDTWVSDTQWRREAVFGKGRFVRSRNGKKRYRLVEGPDADVLQFVLTAMEPIPATDRFAESDWRIKRDVAGGVATIRVATGHENPDGTPNPKDFNAYWFDETGQLVRTYLNELQSRRSNFEDFNGMSMARRVEVLLAGKVGMRIDVTELGPAGPVDAGMFTIKRHNWSRQYTTEVR